MCHTLLQRPLHYGALRGALRPLLCKVLPLGLLYFRSWLQRVLQQRRAGCCRDYLQSSHQLIQQTQAGPSLHPSETSFQASQSPWPAAKVVVSLL